MNQCSLCCGSVQPFSKDRRRSYFQCETCSLVQVLPAQWLTQLDEKSEYDKHENSAEDLGYRRFLSRMLEPMLERLPFEAREDLLGLDFGSGPEPVLQSMFAEHGLQQEIFDIFYANQPTALQGCYDFITSTEVVEHLQKPGEELNHLWSLLRPGGLLGIMTKRVIDQSAFKSWHYKNDPTHICFFAESTFEYLAREWGAQLEIVSADVVILKKPKT